MHFQMNLIPDRVVETDNKHKHPGTHWGEPEKDYASYIGIEGNPEMVEKAVDLIKKYASYIKNESPGSRQYI